LVTAQEAPQHYQSGGGSAKVQGKLVPFVSGPKDESGRVIQVAPKQHRTLPPEHTTEWYKRAKELAEEGHVVPTAKPLARVLTADEIKSLHVSVPVIHSANPAPPNQPSSVRTNSSQSVSPQPAGNNPSPSFPGIGDDGLDPPDGGVAAGPLNVVAVVNDTIQVYDKSGNLLSSQSLFDLFRGLPGTSDQIFDPSIAYDADIGRFWVVAISAHDAIVGDSTNRSTLFVAVSNSSDVTSGGWSTFFFDATINGDGSDGDRFACDFPHFGIDAQAIYLSCNMYSFPFFSSTTTFKYSKVRILTKSQFTGGACCTWWDFWNLRENLQGSTVPSFTIRPAIMHFSNAADGDFWINAEENGTMYKIRRLTNAQNCCNGVGPTLEEVDFASLSFSVPPGAAQPGTSSVIDTTDTRILFATWQAGHLSAGQNLACNPGDANHACLGFAEIDVSSYPNNMTNVSDFAVGMRGEDLYYPYVEQNANGDKTIVYTRSDGTSTFAGAYMRGIPNSSICQNCILDESVLRVGENTYLAHDPGSRENRWGDYMGAGADPDGIGVWVEGEYATSFPGLWSTEIAPTYNTYLPGPTFQRNPLPFGNTTVFTSNALTEFVTNNGNAPLNVGSLSVSGDPDFTIIFDACSSTTVQVGNFCSLILQFLPTKTGAGNASLQFPFNGLMTQAGLSGTGIQDASATAISSSKNPSNAGDSLTFTAVVSATSSNAIPTGSVSFKDGGSVLGSSTLNAGTATFTTSSLSGGNHGITAAYGGDSNFGPSNGSVTQTVQQQSTTTTLATSVNPSGSGLAVIFTASVSPNAATGTVTFKDGAVVLGTIAVAAGKASLSSSTLAPGGHSITATYNGSAAFGPSTSAVLSQTVNKASTQTTAVSSPNPSVFKQSVIFTATVVAVAPGSGTPTGTVTFMNGTTILGTGSLAGGKATFSTAALKAGSNSITAVYGGSAAFNASTSAVLTQTVHKASTTTTLTSSLDPSKLGAAVTFTITVAPVAPGGGTPKGSVTLSDGSAAVGTATLINGKATISTSKLTHGTHSMTATYSGDTNHRVSTSAALVQTVN
jgi:hypothetical protein